MLPGWVPACVPPVLSLATGNHHGSTYRYVDYTIWDVKFKAQMSIHPDSMVSVQKSLDSGLITGTVGGVRCADAQATAGHNRWDPIGWATIKDRA